MRRFLACKLYSGAVHGWCYGIQYTPWNSSACSSRDPGLGASTNIIASTMNEHMITLRITMTKPT